MDNRIQHPDGDTRRIFPYVKEKSASDNLNGGFTITTNYTFDNWGNLTNQDVDHDGEGTTNTTNTYQTVNGWCDSELDISTTVKTRTGVAGNYARTIDYNYSNGHLSQAIADESSTSLKVTTDYLTYNQFGLLEKFTVTGSGKTKTTNLKYDNKGRAPIEKTIEGPDSVDFVTEKTYDFKTGNVLTEKNVLGKETIYTYDTFGKLIQTTLPNGKKVNYEISWAGGEGPSGTVYFTKTSSEGFGDSRAFYDIPGRKLREETTGFNGTKIYRDTEYDDFGRISKEYEPYFVGSPGVYTSYNYESNSGRIDNIVAPNGTTNYDYSTEKQIKVTNTAGQSTTKTINAYGDVSTVKDAKNSTVNYIYNSAGLPETISTTGSGSISLAYDLHGNRTSITDPNAGTVITTFDAFGNILTQSDANGSYTMVYDNMNRMTLKTGTDGVTDYKYYTTGGGLGQIESIDYKEGEITTGYTYDDFGRLLSTTEDIDGKDYSYAYTYDDFGREKTVNYPSGFGITNDYHVDYGYLTEIKQTGGSAIWTVDDMNALGQYTQVSKGNGKTTTYNYDAYHFPKTIETPGIAEFEYFFDAQTGNLDWRKDLKRGLVESFNYDNLNRLEDAYYGYGTTLYQHLDYNNNGNIDFKTDAGTYSYHPGKLHAVTGVTNDLSIIDATQQDITYTAFNKVKDIDEGNFSLDFTYGADHQRRKTVLKDGGSIIKTKYFLGAYEEEITVANETRKIHYITGGDGLAAVLIMDDANPDGKMYYTYTDHLGSIVAITDNLGALLEEQSFDPCSVKLGFWEQSEPKTIVELIPISVAVRESRRRNPADWDDYTNIPAFNLLDRGYTGHEHLPEFGLINMNGRLYDPILGRMLSPDNFVQMPDFT